MMKLKQQEVLLSSFFYVKISIPPSLLLLSDHCSSLHCGKTNDKNSLNWIFPPGKNMSTGLNPREVRDEQLLTTKSGCEEISAWRALLIWEGKRWHNWRNEGTAERKLIFLFLWSVLNDCCFMPSASIWTSSLQVSGKMLNKCFFKTIFIVEFLCKMCFPTKKLETLEHF